jgi:hypothetical protein
MMFKLNYQDYLFTFILLLIIHVSIVFGSKCLYAYYIYLLNLNLFDIL